MTEPKKRSCYETLDVAPDVSRRELAVAYRRICGFMSPDTLALYGINDPEEIKALRHEVDDAFWVLNDETRRGEYDAYLAARGARRQPSPPSPPAPASAPALEVVPEPLPPVVSEGVPLEIESSEPSPAPAPVAAAPAELPAEVVDGAFLRRVREAAGLTVEQIAHATKIGRHHLLAVEGDAFDVLPAEVYVRGFVQQMARLLGLDPKATSRAYLEVYRASR